MTNVSTIKNRKTLNIQSELVKHTNQIRIKLDNGIITFYTSIK